MERQLLIKRRLEVGTNQSRSSDPFPGNTAGYKWQCLDEFLQTHITEALLKQLKEQEGGGERNGQDQIWGKLILMERGSRLAKIYLRDRMVVVDGSDTEFDGKTVGFNHFTGIATSEHGVDLRRKIGDGLILKITNHGSVKAMALGNAPIYLLDWDDTDRHCFPDSIFRTQGVLPTRMPSGSDSGRVVKLFDFQHFIHALEEYEEHGGEPSDLFYKACIRMAMVKKSTSWDKHPAWFLLINSRALGLLAKRVPLDTLFVIVLARRDPNEKLRPLSKAAQINKTQDDIAEDRKVELLLAKMLADALEKVSHMQTSMFERMALPISMGQKTVEESISTHKGEESDEEGSRRSKIHMALRGSRKQHKRPALTHTLFRKPRTADESGNELIFTSDYESSNRGGDDDASFFDSLSGSSTASWEGDTTNLKQKSICLLNNATMKGYYYCENEEQLPVLPQQKRLPRIYFTHNLGAPNGIERDREGVNIQ